MFRLLTATIGSLFWVLVGLAALVGVAYDAYPVTTTIAGSLVAAFAICVIWGAILEWQDRRTLVDARMRDEIVPAMSPIEYEQFVTRLLLRAGWNARHCGRQGDQGCDVKAELRGFRAVVQVKHYRGRCPNTAVQEAVGARLHYSAQIMVVVAPNGFTRSAVELAHSNGVHLLHHSELHTLEKLARIP